MASMQAFHLVLFLVMKTYFCLPNYFQQILAEAFAYRLKISL